jgi:hypothetical protein
MGKHAGMFERVSRTGTSGKHRPVRLGRLIAAVGCSAMLGGCVSEVPPAGYGSPGAAPGYGYVCYAGAYQCRLPQQVPAGSECSCPGIGAPSWGHVR